jgi:hypothetical protein
MRSSGTWGGRREGAGRKATGQGPTRVSLALSGRLEELDRLRELAKEAGKTVSSYVLDALVRRAPVKLDTEGEKG